MIILGVDPGSTRAGYGIINFDEKSQEVKYVAGGIIEVSSVNKNEQLVQLRNSLDKIIKKYNPKLSGIEKIYFNKNVKTAIEVAQARGVLIVCVQDKKIPIYEFTPSAIKQGLTGYGVADKKSVEKMVKRVLKIEDLHQPDDVYDALAVALVTGYSIHTRNILKKFE